MVNKKQAVQHNRCNQETNQHRHINPSRLTFSFVLPRQPRQPPHFLLPSLQQTHSPPSSHLLSLPLELILSRLPWISNMCLGVEKGEKKRTGRVRTQDLQYRLFVVGSLFSGHSWYRFGNIIFPQVTISWHEKCFSLHLSRELCRWRDMHPGTSYYMLKVYL